MGRGAMRSVTRTLLIALVLSLAWLRSNQAASQMFLTQLYQGLLRRPPTVHERAGWVSYLLQAGDVRSVTEFFVKSQEYSQRSKNEQQALRDLHEGLYGRAPSS